MDQISCCPVSDRLPPLSGEHMWFVAQMLDAEEDMTGDQVFYRAHDPRSQYWCRVPELIGRRIRGCFHGWVVLSNHPHNVMWSLWNPSISKFIRLPRLNHELGGDHDINECCLSSPPDDPAGSILLLTIKEKPTFAFCRLDRKRKKLRWTEMSYAKQLKEIIREEDNRFLECLTCCNGKVYALSVFSERDSPFFTGDHFVIEVNIVVTPEEVVISVLPFVKLPCYSLVYGSAYYNGPFLIGTRYEKLFIIYTYIRREKLCSVRLLKLDMTSKLLEEMEDFDDDEKEEVACFIEGYCSRTPPAIASKSGGGGYIHMLLEDNELIMYSYHVKDKKVFKSYVPRRQDYFPAAPSSRTSYVSVWAMPETECSNRLGGEITSRLGSKVEGDTVEVKSQSSGLFNIPFDVLKTIMELCVDIDYVNFRATCKRLTAPVTQWSNESSMARLQRYSLVSPWLMVLDKDRSIITFTDPMFGDHYSVRTPPDLNGDLQIWFSMYGWLLMSDDTTGRMFLFNPFIGDIRKLPNLDARFIPFMDSFCFSDPPSSPDCVVVGIWGDGVLIHFVAQEPAAWDKFTLKPTKKTNDEPRDFENDEQPEFTFSIAWDRDISALNKEGRLSSLEVDEDYRWDHVAIAPISCCRSAARYFLVRRDHDLLLVQMDELGDSIELFRLNRHDKKWEKIDGLGKHMIFICDTSCLCTEARIPEMENKIYFPALHSKNEKTVFYSLDTCMYHTFSGKSIVDSFGNLFGTKEHLQPHVWIEPSYS